MKENQNTKNLISQSSGGMAFTVMIICFLLVILIGQIILLAFNQTSGYVFQAVSGCFSSVAIICAVFFISKRNKIRLKPLIGFNKFNPLYICLALFFSISMFFGFGFINGLVAEFLFSLGLKTGGIELELSSPDKLAVYLVVFALLPAVFEEIFFRGLINRSLENTNILVSALVGGLFFALYHTSLTQFFYQFIYGFGLTIIARISCSVIPCIIAHLCNNTAVILLTYFNQTVDLYNGFIILGGLLGIVVFATIACFIIKKSYVRKQMEKERLTQFFISGIVGEFVCVLLIIASLFV